MPTVAFDGTGSIEIDSIDHNPFSAEDLLQNERPPRSCSGFASFDRVHTEPSPDSKPMSHADGQHQLIRTGRAREVRNLRTRNAGSVKSVRVLEQRFRIRVGAR